MKKSRDALVVSPVASQPEDRRFKLRLTSVVFCFEIHLKFTTRFTVKENIAQIAGAIQRCVGVLIKHFTAFDDGDDDDQDEDDDDSDDKLNYYYCY